MATRKALKAINWTGIAERLREEDRAFFMAFKGKSDQYLRKVQLNPEKSPAIDWAFYQKQVTVSSMVDNFKKQYEALSVPYPKDSFTTMIDEQAKQSEAVVQKFITTTNQQIDELNSKIAAVNALMPFSEMTMEDVYDMYPDKCLDPINRPTVWPHHPDDQHDDPPAEGH